MFNFGKRDEEGLVKLVPMANDIPLCFSPQSPYRFSSVMLVVGKVRKIKRISSTVPSA